MKAKIVGSRILHRVWFAPDPKNKAFPTSPKVVPTRLIRDILEFPEGVDYVSFDDVVETEVRVGVRTEWVYSTPFNKSEVHFVIHTKPQTKTSEWAIRNHEIEVHPSLKGKIWVFGDARQFAAQKTA
jgi:hypothetical protein